MNRIGDERSREMEQVWDLAVAGWIMGTYQLNNGDGRFSPRTGGLTRAQLYDPHKFRIKRSDDLLEGWTRLTRGQDEDADLLDFDFFFPSEWRWTEDADLRGVDLNDPVAVFRVIAAGLGTRGEGVTPALRKRCVGPMPWPSGNSTLMDAAIEFCDWSDVSLRRSENGRLTLATALGPIR